MIDIWMLTQPRGQKQGTAQVSTEAQGQKDMGKSWVTRQDLTGQVTVTALTFLHFHKICLQ